MSVIVAALAAGAARADEALEAVAAAVPACDAARAHCFGLALHVVVDRDGAAQTPAWVAAQVAQANRHFAAADVGFELGAVDALPAELGAVETRKQRDALGRARAASGRTIHVFVVRRLADLDGSGDIYGVHWRDRGGAKRRWIILSAEAWERTLAHELGHFFGLPHSSHPVSIMNKAPRATPPPEERTFAPEEVARLEKGLARLRAAGQPVDRRAPTD